MSAAAGVGAGQVRGRGWKGRKVTASHLSHVQQVDLQEEAESTSCDLVGRSANRVAQLVADGQGTPLALRKQREEHLIDS